MTEMDIPTMDVLRGFGFDPDLKMTEEKCLTFDFEHFELTAIQCTNRTSNEAVLLFGVITTPRRLADVTFEMPSRVASRELCAAWIVWYLDQCDDEAITFRERQDAWVIEGRRSKHLLPWFIEQATDEDHPRCVVSRDQIRAALRCLATQLAHLTNEAQVILEFKSRVLLIKYADQVTALTGEGASWPERFAIPAGSLRRLPRRLMDVAISIEILDAHLIIGNLHYPGVVALPNPHP